ncbi:STAS domain-containing protein [Leptolyngbya sp. FACHB-261]|uniref:STAS domain-containing protein n=1 Tax=Leptolyngbya sp. FACHB-261 TaxID=2692806 RepID=UPI0016830DD2|nr:STAS domain-containing protein [Leptolyngbya sp. FACHB-261]MBD2105164.1 STAS domain-containing protein [Leptolyngbya sp. FACHB-261]
MPPIATNSIVKVVRPSDSLNGNKINSFLKEVSEAISTETKAVLINLQDVIFMDSSGLGAIVSAFKTVCSVGVRFAICSINDQVKMLFELTGMDQVFDIFADQDEFVSKVLLS